MSVPLQDDQPLVIGRSRGDLVLDDPLISGAHCRVVYKSGHYTVEDLGSTNGTVVDGKQVSSALLAAGSRIEVGNTELLMCSGVEDTAEDDVARNDVAWLLDSELIDAEAPLGAGDDVIGAGLRLPNGCQARAEVITGPDKGSVLTLRSGTIAIGRRQGEIALSDTEVSRRHAFIEIFGPDMIFVRDVASTNGTYHNGRRVSLASMESGDTVGCGKSVLRLELSFAPPVRGR